jgi:hypothetical protein
VPCCWDKGRIVFQRKVVEDVKHDLCGELVNREGVQSLELKAGLEAFLNVIIRGLSCSC